MSDEPKIPQDQNDTVPESDSTEDSGKSTEKKDKSPSDNTPAKKPDSNQSGKNKVRLRLFRWRIIPTANIQSRKLRKKLPPRQSTAGMANAFIPE